MPDEIDWDKLLKDEDRILDNSDRKHRDHFKSLESMSEEFVYRQSMDRYLRGEFDSSKSSFDFTTSLQDEKLADAIRKLTKRQRQVIELYYWHGYKQTEMAEMLGCSQMAVSQLISRALKRLKKNLSEG